MYEIIVVADGRLIAAWESSPVPKEMLRLTFIFPANTGAWIDGPLFTVYFIISVLPNHIRGTLFTDYLQFNKSPAIRVMLIVKRKAYGLCAINIDGIGFVVSDKLQFTVSQLCPTSVNRDSVSVYIDKYLPQNVFLKTLEMLVNIVITASAHTVEKLGNISLFTRQQIKVIERVILPRRPAVIRRNEIPEFQHIVLRLQKSYC